MQIYFIAKSKHLPYAESNVGLLKKYLKEIIKFFLPASRLRLLYINNTSFSNRFYSFFQVKPRLQISMSYSIRQKRKEQTETDSMILIKKEKKEEWKNFSFLSAAKDGIDCGDKQCFLEYRVVPDCYVVLETNNTNCQIPCLMDGCDKELHHFIPCALWNCEAITTTPSTTTTTSSTTTLTSTTAQPNPNPIEPSRMSPLIYTSIVLNIIFVGILLAYLIVRFRIWITVRLANFRNRTTDPTPIVAPDPNRHFSVGSNSDTESDSGVQSNEKQPLIPKTSKNSIVNHGHENLGLDNSNADPIPSTSSNWHEVSHAILGLGPDPMDNINLASSSETAPANHGPLLNDVEANKEVKTSEKSIFLRMKIFQKK